LLMLVLGIGSWSGCTMKLPPGENNGRECYLGVVPTAQVEAVKPWAPAAQAGDVLITRACDDQRTELLLNVIRHNAR
jgi:hypothetical protein